MSLLSRLIPREQRDLAAAEPEKRMLVNSAFVPPAYDGLGSDLVGERQALQSMAVWACVTLLADVIASMPWYIYRRDKDNIPQRIYPTPNVIRQPCADMDLFEWKWMVVAGLALRGNSYHLVTARDNTGYPTGLMPVHPDMVFLERRVNVLEWYDPIYRVLGERVAREDIVHIRRFTLPGDPHGLSPIRQAARAIGINLAADEYGYRYFRDSATPSGTLRTEQTLTDDEVAQVQAEWLASHAGHRYPAVLTGGFDFKPISITPEESQFLEARGYQVSDIARLYRVPPHLIGDQEKATSWGSGIESMNLGFHTYTLMGWTTCIESAISSFLPRGQVVRFDPSSLLRGDFKTQVEALKAAREAGLLSANEGRSKMDYAPIENGDGYIQPLNYGPLGATPEMTPIAKSIQAETVPGASAPVPGQEAEPPGIAARTPHLKDLQCRIDRHGRPEYYDARTGQTVLHQEESNDQ